MSCACVPHLFLPTGSFVYCVGLVLIFPLCLCSFLAGVLLLLLPLWVLSYPSSCTAFCPGVSVVVVPGFKYCFLHMPLSLTGRVLPVPVLLPVCTPLLCFSPVGFWFTGLWSFPAPLLLVMCMFLCEGRGSFVLVSYVWFLFFLVFLIVSFCWCGVLVLFGRFFCARLDFVRFFARFTQKF